MQNQYEILKCLNYINNLLSSGYKNVNYEKLLYRWYDGSRQSILCNLKTDEKEHRIKITDFLGLIHKKIKKFPNLKQSIIEKNMLLFSEIFQLNEKEKELIGLMYRVKNCGFLRNFLEDFLGYGWENLEVCAQLLGITNAQLMKILRKDSSLLKTDIIDYDYRDKIELNKWVGTLIIGKYKSKEDMLMAITGKPLSCKLTLNNFSHIPQYDKISLLLKNAVKRKEKGINILLYGTVGSGKTEFAKTLAHHNGLKLFAVAEETCGYSNISNYRIRKLKSILHAMEKEDNVVLMCDEVEDIFYNSPFQDRPNISKVEMNRLLENTPKPVIWICNQIKYLDKAYLRRFSYIARIERPNQMINKNILAQNLKKYHIKYQENDLNCIAKKYNFTPAVLENAAKVTSLMDGNISDMQAQLDAVQQVMTGKSERLKKYNDFISFNPQLLNTDLDLTNFNQQIINLKKLDFSLCLYGASGTGKTAYANYLAQSMGLEVLEKRASDLIGSYVGETEQNIASAFEEAKQNKSVLIFDEGDSFLQDRTNAVRSWEITQVNEMLTQMEAHPYPFICTTNLMTNIDKASLRRFTFKIKYDYMTEEQIKLAFKHFFNLDIDDNIGLKLTPGDFSVVKKKAEIMGFSQNKEKIVAMLTTEQSYREPVHKKIGFL